MSISIENIVLHEVVQDESCELTLHPSNHAQQCGANTEHLVCELHRLFISKAGKGFGQLQESTDVQCAIEHLIKGDKTFLAITTVLAQRFVEELCKYPMAGSGVLVFAEYMHFNHRYLFIGLIPKADSLSMDESQDIVRDAYLDIAHMAIAARINMTDIINDELESSTSFIRPGNKKRMNDFFIDFLGLDMATETKYQNQVLLQAVEDFIKDAQLESDDEIMMQKVAYAYCDGQVKLKEELSMTELSDAFGDTTTQGEFSQYIEDNGYELDDTFQGDRGVLKGLVKCSGSGGGLSMSFDAQLLNERVFYDLDTDTLTIKGTPARLRDQLIRRAKPANKTA